MAHNNPQATEGERSSISSNTAQPQQAARRRNTRARTPRFVEHFDISASMAAVNPFDDPEPSGNDDSELPGHSDPFPEPLNVVSLFSATADYERPSPASPASPSSCYSSEPTTPTGLNRLQGPTATLRSGWSSSSSSSDGIVDDDENANYPEPPSPTASTSSPEPAQPRPLSPLDTATLGSIFVFGGPPGHPEAPRRPLSPLDDITLASMFVFGGPPGHPEAPRRPLSPLDDIILASIFLQPADESDREYLRQALEAVRRMRRRETAERSRRAGLRPRPRWFLESDSESDGESENDSESESQSDSD